MTNDGGMSITRMGHTARRLCVYVSAKRLSVHAQYVWSVKVFLKTTTPQMLLTKEHHTQTTKEWKLHQLFVLYISLRKW